MTFEFIDADGDVLRADAVATQDGGPHVALTIGNWEHGQLTTADVAVDVDHVEEVVAGIRDAARQAAGRPPAPKGWTWSLPPAARQAPTVSLATSCDNCDHALNWHGNHAACIFAFCGCGRFRAPEQPAVEQPAEAQPVDLLAECATEYHVPVPEGGGTNLLVRRQALVHGTGWSVCTRAYGGGRAWTTEGWQESISALSVDRLFCWPDPATAVDEARRALAVEEGPR